MLKQMKKTLGILLAVCFLMSVTAAAVSAGPVMVKDKKTSIVILKDVKTKIFKHHHGKYHHHGKFSRHHYKNKTMKGRKGKKMAFKTETVNKMPTKTGIGSSIPVKTGAGSNLPMNI